MLSSRRLRQRRAQELSNVARRSVPLARPRMCADGQCADRRAGDLTGRSSAIACSSSLRARGRQGVCHSQVASQAVDLGRSPGCLERGGVIRLQLACDPVREAKARPDSKVSTHPVTPASREAAIRRRPRARSAYRDSTRRAGCPQDQDRVRRMFPECDPCLPGGSTEAEQDQVPVGTTTGLERRAGIERDKLGCTPHRSRG